jgi:mRNA interferase RelE/StbE
MSQPYGIELTPAAKRDLKRLDSEVRHRVATALERLALQDDPYGHVKKLEGAPESAFYALRVGDYRVILTIEDRKMLIFVFEIDQRKTIYRKF